MSCFVGKSGAVTLFLDDQARGGILISESDILLFEFQRERWDEEKISVWRRKLYQKKTRGKYVHRRETGRERENTK